MTCLILICIISVINTGILSIIILQFEQSDYFWQKFILR